jgi:hypothetical protein
MFQPGGEVHKARVGLAQCGDVGMPAATIVAEFVARESIGSLSDNASRGTAR